MAILWYALIGDILDGIIARHLESHRQKCVVRILLPDLIFWLSWSSHMELASGDISASTWLDSNFLVLEALTYIVSFAKFGKEWRTCLQWETMASEFY